MKPCDQSEIYSAIYGNLRLEVRRLTSSGGQDFEYRVVDSHDEGVYWFGDAPDLETAQGNAVFEAQIFVDVIPSHAPGWQCESKSV